MFNATLKRSLFILLLGTLVGLAGCSNPEEKRAEQIENALELSRGGSDEAALEMLDRLTVHYPNDPEILQSIGRIYARQGDSTMAAFYLEQAHIQNPDDIELLYETYQALEAAGDPSGEILEKLAARSPEAMNQRLWLELGQFRAENNRTEAALEAYLKGIDPENEPPSPETAAAIGQLFAKLGNDAQAASWFETAADSDAPSALTALFGLLEIQLSQKNWPEAEATITRLSQQFPGAIEASEWQQASEELKRWRAAQETMKAKLAAAEAAKAEAARAAEEEAIEIAEAESDASKRNTDSEGTATSERSEEEGEESDGDRGKSQVIADLEAAEDLADRPAEEATSETTVTFNPNIAITPADPDLSIGVSFDEEGTAPETQFSFEAETEAPVAETFQPEPPRPAIRPAEQPTTLEELLIEAETAERERDYKSAIRKYWAAIGIANNRANIWNLLSRAYLVDGQLQNADTAALESVRLAPGEVAYTLDFLRVAQRSRPPEEFLAQLETAYDRFPSSPEITLSLARAHERISGNEFAARNLYLRFIDLAPNHPLRSEAESAAARLR